MIVIYKGEEIATDAPKELIKGDTIIIDGDVYEVYTKTYDFDNSCLYVQVGLYKEAIQAIDILQELYESNCFISSGFNTNEIEKNPRLLAALAVIAVVVGEEHMDKMGSLYRENIISRWNQTSILWSDILVDNPEAVHIKIDTLKGLCVALLKHSKITPVVWPEALR